MEKLSRTAENTYTSLGAGSGNRQASVGIIEISKVLKDLKLIGHGQATDVWTKRSIEKAIAEGVFQAGTIMPTPGMPKMIGGVEQKIDILEFKDAKRKTILLRTSDVLATYNKYVSPDKSIEQATRFCSYRITDKLEGDYQPELFHQYIDDGSIEPITDDTVFPKNSVFTAVGVKKIEGYFMIIGGKGDDKTAYYTADNSNSQYCLILDIT